MTVLNKKLEKKLRALQFYIFRGLRGEPCEAFDLANLHDIKEQFFHHCVIQKGLFPEKPLPKSLPKEIENHVR